MSATDDSFAGWRVDKKPPVMTKQFVFDSYEHTRSFVNKLADLSESTGYYPNLTYSRTQATVTVFTDEAQLGDKEYDFATATDRIAGQFTQTAE